MLARLRRTTEENEGGFTLIELLVVMIIIGILAAIAIPAFLSQKKKGYEASMKSDLRSIATEITTQLVDNPATVAITQGAGAITVGAGTINTSPGVALGTGSFVTPSTGAYCVALTHLSSGATGWKIFSTGTGTQSLVAGSC